MANDNFYASKQAAACEIKELSRLPFLLLLLKS